MEEACLVAIRLLLLLRGLSISVRRIGHDLLQFSVARFYTRETLICDTPNL